jgi:threonine/homoserine/homoserine lactone efflux protein
MSTLTPLIAFVVVGAAITVSPGPDSLLVLRTAVVAGPRKALAAAAGVCTGLFAWALSAALGISAVLAESALLFDFIKWTGAAYLCWLGIRLLQSSRRQSVSADPDIVDVRRDQSFAIELLTNISNPKVGVFYVSLLPQFVPDGVSAGPFMAGLAVIHIAEGALWFAFLVLATRPLARWLARPHVLQILDRVTGVIMIGLGARLTFDRR